MRLKFEISGENEAEREAERETGIFSGTPL